ncbi:cytochrome P450 monooxygenase [Xylogone sp. PMI_703]|nr:cytochrome P450 monooxygenase [Xylogone sp. PMI_703]
METILKTLERFPTPPLMPLDLISSILFTIATSLFLRILYTTILYPEFLTPLKKIPTPVDRSFLRGNTGISKTYQLANFRHWSKTVPNSGLIRYYQPGNHERLLVTSQRALSEILVTNAHQFVKPQSARHRLWYITGNGLLLAEGEEHKVQRKSLMAAFSFRHIKDLHPVFWSKARELVRCLEAELQSDKVKGNNIIEMRGWASRATLDIIGVAGMDHDFNSLQDSLSSLTRQYQLLRPNPSRFELLLGMILSPISARAAVIVSILPSKRKAQARAASKYLRDLCRSLIQEKIGKLEKDTSNTNVDIISVALRSGTFSDRNLVDQMMTFLAAGHGTTSHALQWAMYALSKHQDIQLRLRKEVCEGLPSISEPEQSISPADIDSLHYLHAFCNEVLRRYAPVPTTIREALNETTVAGYRIPKGTLFIISPGMTNLDQDLWGPDADTFNPERWLQDGCANTGGVRNNYGFLTFLHGPRSCIGATFARSELTCLVAALVGRFEMELEDPEREVEITSQGIGNAPADGTRIKLKVLDEL